MSKPKRPKLPPPPKVVDVADTFQSARDKKAKIKPKSNIKTTPLDWAQNADTRKVSLLGETARTEEIA